MCLYHSNLMVFGNKSGFAAFFVFVFPVWRTTGILSRIVDLYQLAFASNGPIRIDRIKYLPVYKFFLSSQRFSSDLEISTISMDGRVPRAKEASTNRLIFIVIFPTPVSLRHFLLYARARRLNGLKLRC